ncbi:hypothetical protein E4U43_005391 [Claviceps pusilla]|uniref:Uncharacterized protein n=1 Tax=Claviceps pusilla TaxID=123648 RepID=A0A9P7N2W4_9HYPO|nr:hypothetical protein E4U43_005391 [Claviceps pusilla]
MAKTQEKTQDVKTAQPVDDDEPDEWDKRIFSTGCAECTKLGLWTEIDALRCWVDADENMKMTDCYFAKKDWRACAAEMQDFKQCWKRHGNDQRTATKEA